MPGGRSPEKYLAETESVLRAVGLGFGTHFPDPATEVLPSTPVASFTSNISTLASLRAGKMAKRCEAVTTNELVRMRARPAALYHIDDGSPSTAPMASPSATARGEIAMPRIVAEWMPLSRSPPEMLTGLLASKCGAKL